MESNESPQNLDENRQNSAEANEQNSFKPKILNLNIILNKNAEDQENAKAKNKENSEQKVFSDLNNKQKNSNVNNNFSFKRYIPNLQSPEGKQSSSENDEPINNSIDEDKQNIIIPTKFIQKLTSDEISSENEKNNDQLKKDNKNSEHSTSLEKLNNIIKKGNDSNKEKSDSIVVIK